MSVTSVGQRLKKARLDAGLTQADIAKRLGITYQAISNYERGVTRVDTDTLVKLCQILGIEVTDILRTPLWDDGQYLMFQSKTSPTDKLHLIDKWGCPDDLIQEVNELKEPTKKPPGISPGGKYADIAELLDRLNAEQVAEIRGYIKRFVEDCEAAKAAKQISGNPA